MQGIWYDTSGYESGLILIISKKINVYESTSWNGIGDITSSQWQVIQSLPELQGIRLTHN